MINALTSWAKAIVMAIIIVSILEMLLPNNKTKKYIKMVMGLFILYNIISPFIKDKNALKFEEADLQTFTSSEIKSIEVNQESMDRRLEELYIQQIEKDITKKLEKKGYKVKSCKVQAKISNDEDTTGITKIKLKIEKGEKQESEDEKQDEEIENKLITTIQSIKKVDTRISKAENMVGDALLEKVDIQNIKQFLIKEYEVNEKCLEIN
ncbi:MAG: stage III sporulation protein AF [Clostridia bacterium]|nr:stage III sporulation protein AF [Clostridia bacterium]